MRSAVVWRHAPLSWAAGLLLAGGDDVSSRPAIGCRAVIQNLIDTWRICVRVAERRQPGSQCGHLRGRGESWCAEPERVPQIAAAGGQPRASPHISQGQAAYWHQSLVVASRTQMWNTHLTGTCTHNRTLRWGHNHTWHVTRVTVGRGRNESRARPAAGAAQRRLVYEACPSQLRCHCTVGQLSLKTGIN